MDYKITVIYGAIPTDVGRLVVHIPKVVKMFLKVVSVLCFNCSRI